ncbi:MAG: hypothetical protein JW751_00255 [Polyangiaceae bacterium]|nr:hypothetical protein [Polyangiaceae bacterium]
MTSPAIRLERLLRCVRWGLDHSVETRQLLPMLEQLLAAAPSGSDAQVLAQRHLARLLLERHPWRAARLAREALATAEDDQTYVVLGIAHTLLQNFRSARVAYWRALSIAPGNVCCLHNLGHLLDVAFDRPAAALPYLRAAHAAIPDEPELAASYAHALGRVGQIERARHLLRQALGSTDGRAERLLDEWLGPPTDGRDPALSAVEA